MGKKSNEKGGIMLDWLLVILSMIGGAFVGTIFYLFFISPINKRIQTGGKEIKQWKIGDPLPGERLPLVSFIFGTLATILSRGLMYTVGAWILYLKDMPNTIIPMLIFSLLFVPNDIQRINKFQGNSGQIKEIGYFVGGIIAIISFIIIRHFF